MENRADIRRYSFYHVAKKGVAILGVVLGGFVSIPVYAETTKIGVSTPKGENGLPFGDINTTKVTRYQQIYGASAFSALSEPVSINSLTFFAPDSLCSFFGCYSQIKSIATGDYAVRLSTTTKSVDALSFDMDANLGSAPTTFFSGQLSNTMTINGTTPFVYDKSTGNLIMDIIIGNQAANYTYFEASTSQGDQMSRLWSSNGTSAVTVGAASARTHGLVTEFGYTSVSAVPEPETYAMLLAGLAIVGMAARRKVAQGKCQKVPSVPFHSVVCT